MTRNIWNVVIIDETAPALVTIVPPSGDPNHEVKSFVDYEAVIPEAKETSDAAMRTAARMLVHNKSSIAQANILSTYVSHTSEQTFVTVIEVEVTSGA